MKKYLLKNKKFLIKFSVTFIISFIVVQLLEHAIEYYFGINLHDIPVYGWLGGIIIYGFKYHIICCLIPAIYTGYVCRHKKCDHEQCKK